MEPDSLDDINQPKSLRNKTTKTIAISLVCILAICVLIFFSIGALGGQYAYLSGLIFAIIAFPVQCIVLGVIYFLTKPKEGQIMLLIGVASLLFGAVVCGRLL